MVRMCVAMRFRHCFQFLSETHCVHDSPSFFYEFVIVFDKLFMFRDFIAVAYDFARSGPSFAVRRRTKVQCDTSMHVITPADGMFYLPSTGIGIGDRAPINASELSPANPMNETLVVRFSTRVRLLDIHLASSFNQTINATLYTEFGPLTPDERALNTPDAPQFSNRVIPLDTRQWQPEEDDSIFCTAFQIESYMPQGTFVFSNVTVKVCLLRIRR